MDRCLAVCAANVKLCALNIYRERETKKERGEDRQCKSLSAFLFPIPTFLRHYVFLLSTTRKRRTEELLRAVRGKHGLVQLSARGVVCSALVCIVSTRPTSLCKPTTRRLLSLWFFFFPLVRITTSSPPLTRKQTVERQKHRRCRLGSMKEGGKRTARPKRTIWQLDVQLRVNLRMKDFLFPLIGDRGQSVRFRRGDPLA